MKAAELTCVEGAKGGANEIGKNPTREMSWRQMRVRKKAEGQNTGGSECQSNIVPRRDIYHERSGMGSRHDE